jgi:hypothetical protein
MLTKKKSASLWAKQLSKISLPLACLLVAFMIPSKLVAQNKNYSFCFSNTSWFGLAPPTIDGNIDQGAQGPDIGWRGGFRYVFDNRTNGTIMPNVTVQGVQDPNNLYLGFEFHTSLSDPNDAIMIAFDPTGNAADQRLLTIYPYIGGGTATNVSPTTAPDYYVGGNTFPGAGGTTAALPTWLTPANAMPNLRISTSAAGMDYLYSVELKIPLVGGSSPADAWPRPNNANVGGSGNFGLYLNVIRIVVSGGSSTAAEDSWPAPPDASLATANMVPPPTGQWGFGTTSNGGTCNGVSVASLTANGGTTQLNLTTDNNFTIVVQNSTVNAQKNASLAVGTAVLAPKIFPTLYLDNFGIPNVADLSVKIPAAAGNPAAPHDVAASGTQTYNIGPWNIPAQDPQDLSGPNGFTAVPHRCAIAILDARPPSTDASCQIEAQTPWCFRANIINNAFITNMNFPTTMGTGKMYRGPIAQIATKGYAAQANNEQIFDLQVRTRIIPFRENIAAVGMVNKTDTTNPAYLPPGSLVWTVHGYRHWVGQTITIHGKTYEIATHAGSFGYGLKYEGTKPADWRFQFFGENGNKLEQPVTNTYRIHIKQGDVGYVNATFEGDASAGTGGPVGGRVHCCGQARSPATLFGSFLGLLAIGFVAYRRNTRDS